MNANKSFVHAIMRICFWRVFWRIWSQEVAIDCLRSRNCRNSQKIRVRNYSRFGRLFDITND